MKDVSKTLYIPLYGKAMVSRRGILLKDEKAGEIWQAEGFPLRGKAKSKWLAYYMGMRAAVFDLWVKDTMEVCPQAAVIHIGCGMDSRICRVANQEHLWFDLDFPDVIAQRKRHYSETASYRMISTDVRELSWLESIPGETAIVVMEGVSMYLQPQELTALLEALSRKFKTLSILMDCYTVFAAKVSKYKNPVNEVGVTTLYGIDDPRALECAGLRFLRQRELTPEALICQLPPRDQRIFRKIFAGSFAGKLYRLYELEQG